MIYKNFFKIIMVVSLLLLTIVSASAVIYNSIGGLASDSEFRRIAPDMVITWAGATTITSIDGDGVITNLTTNSARAVVEECVQDILNPKICYYATGSNLWVLNFDINTINSTVINTNGSRSQFRIHSRTLNEYFFTYYNGVSYEWYVTKTLASDDTDSYTLPSGVPEMTIKHISNYKISPTFTTYDATNGYNFWEVYYRQDTDIIYVGVFFNNDTGTESFGYNPLFTTTGLCYDQAFNLNRNFQDSDFPSHLFSNYGTQSDVLLIKPSCRYYREIFVEDLQNLSVVEFPTTYTRDYLFIGQPNFHYPSGVRIGDRSLDTSYYQDEIFINRTHSFVDYYIQDSWLNDENPIYAYNLDETTYYSGFADNIFTTIPLSQGTLIYPTGLYDYTIATNLSTLSTTGLTVTLQDFIETTGNNIGLQYGTDYVTYVLSANASNSVITNVNTNDNTALSITFEDVVFSGLTPVSIDGVGVRSDVVPSNRWSNLIVGGVSLLRQLVDYDLYPSFTYLNYSSNNTVKTVYASGSEGLGDILTLRDTGTQVYLDLGIGNDSYPKTTYTALKTSGFAPLDIDYSCTSGTDDIYLVTAIGSGSSGLGMCFFDRTDVSPVIICDTSPQQATTTAYPYSAIRGGVSAYGQYVTSYYNSTAVINNHLTTCNAASGFTLESICKIPSGVGNVRSMLRVNATHSLIGTTLGNVGVCDVGAGTVTITDLGTITSENESILNFENRFSECSSSGCDETLDNFHFITNKYYVAAKLESGASVPNFCGDLSCSGGESAFSCPVDCSASCGDNFCTHNETAISCPVDCGGAVCGNSICEAGENETSCHVDCAGTIFYFPDPVDDPYIPPENTIELFSMKLFGNKLLFAGVFDGSDEVRKLDLVNKSNLLLLTSLGLLDFAYSVDRFGNNVFVGTDDEIHIISGFDNDSFSLITRDNYFGPHADIHKDYVSITNSSGFVCDNNDEPDYHVLYSDPSGNVAGGCFDMEYDSVKEVLYVDRDDDGVSSYNVSDPNNIFIINTFDNRDSSHGFVSGDLLDLEGDSLLIKKGLYTMSLLDVSNPSSISLITDCHTGGAGEITSVEIYDSTFSLAGTDDGRFILCNTSNNNITTNTDWFTLDDLNGEEIRAVELQDDGTIWFMSETGLQPFVLNFTLVQNNTAPNVSSWSISNDNPDINESIDVQVIAGNVEPEDIIRYGIKCEGTEAEFTYNSNGLFTCEYSSEGTYNLRVAVSDNFHTGFWFDEHSDQVQVTDVTFTGGILRATVLTESQEAIINASVTLTENNQTFFSSEYGLVTFSTPEDNTLYELETTADGYYLSVDNFYSDGSINIITMVAVPTGDESVLEVTVIDSNGLFVENSLVSFTNKVTYEYDWKWSNGIGKAIFTGLDSGAVVVQASKGDYDDGSTVASIVSNFTTQVTITLQDPAGSSGVRVDRDCVDDGIWLCGDVVGSCSVDDDCLSNNCNSALGTCSRFNMSVCDFNNYPRGQKCMFKYSFESGMSGFTNWLLSNFLWVVVIIIVVIAVGIVAFAWKK